MKRITPIVMLAILSFFFTSDVGLCLNGEDIVRLKKAGITDKTVQLMVKEKTKETCAFTVQEIVQLKNSGLSEESIQALIKERSFIKDRKPRVYGKETRPIKFTTAKDIIELKEAGVSDEVIMAIIIHGSRDTTSAEKEKAWEMLKNMGIVIDMRKGNE